MNTPLIRILTPGEVQEMIAVIISILGRPKADIWWTTPNPLLGNVIPAQMLQMGRGRRLYDYVKDAQAANAAIPPYLITRRKRANL